MRFTLLAVLGLLGAPAPSVPPRWQYLVWQDRSFKVERQQGTLDSLGREGWELVSANAIQVTGTTGALLFYFKRPEQEKTQ